MVSTEVKLWFLSSLEHFWPDPWDTLSEVTLFFEKMHKVFKNKAQGCSTPLRMVPPLQNCSFCENIFCHNLKTNKVGLKYIKVYIFVEREFHKESI